MTDYDAQPDRPYPSAGAPRPIPQARKITGIVLEDAWPSETERVCGREATARILETLRTRKDK